MHHSIETVYKWAVNDLNPALAQRKGIIDACESRDLDAIVRVAGRLRCKKSASVKRALDDLAAWLNIKPTARPESLRPVEVIATFGVSTGGAVPLTLAGQPTRAYVLANHTSRHVELADVDAYLEAGGSLRVNYAYSSDARAQVEFR